VQRFLQGEIIMKKIVIAADQAGFYLKQDLAAFLQAGGFEVLDLGPVSAEEVPDYPDIASELASVLLAGDAQRGILVCGSGVGAAMAANKIPGIYAGLCHDTYSARQGVEHDDMNVICVGARVIGPAVAYEVVSAFLAAGFKGEERHARRIGKMKVLEGL
jgi:ribose 5-phosphate isomerase B